MGIIYRHIYIYAYLWGDIVTGFLRLIHWQMVTDELQYNIYFFFRGKYFCLVDIFEWIATYNRGNGA